MGRPLKIQKFNAMAGIFYNPSNPNPTTAQDVYVDQGYPPFAAPTSMDTPTVVLPQPETSPLPFTGVVGGWTPDMGYPVVVCGVNIALPDGSGAGVHDGLILRQKGARKFMVLDVTSKQDEQIIQGASYFIETVGSTNWTLFGGPSNPTVGSIFTATANGTNSGTGVCGLVGTCVLYGDNSPAAGEMYITMSIADSAPTYISKLTNRFAQDFNGGEIGGNANTGNVWNETQVIENIEYAANFFVDGETFAKSGAEVPTWDNGGYQNTNGTLTMAEVSSGF
jgi:hypothetical protein